MNLKFVKNKTWPNIAENGTVWFNSATKTIYLYDNGWKKYAAAGESNLDWGGVI